MTIRHNNLQFYYFCVAHILGISIKRAPRNGARCKAVRTRCGADAGWCGWGSSIHAIEHESGHDSAARSMHCRRSRERPNPRMVHNVEHLPDSDSRRTPGT